MVALSIMIEGQDGLTWSRWQALVAAAEDFGYAGLYRSDHFTNPEPPDKDALEMIVSLTWLADHTQRIAFGPLVAPLSFRDPRLLARQAAALDDLSGGRMILGVGAGWQAREHGVYGYDLGDTAARMGRFEEGLAVITRLLRSDEPVTFAGQFYQLHDATLLPRPQRSGGPRILVGGNGQRRTLALAARYADVWNCFSVSAAGFRERTQTLDRLLIAAGRTPADVRRTVMLRAYLGRSDEELEWRLAWRHDDSEFRGLSLAETVEALRTQKHALIGTPEQMIAGIQTYAAAGAE
ncbi:MAG: TIGR03560 family F420-dependent LLM class oxidoreductase, partial [Ktedonobacterales bacterium]